MAVSGAVALRVAQEQGAGRSDRLRPVAFAALGLALLCLALIGSAFWWGGAAIAAAIASDPAVVQAAALIFAVFAFTQLGDAVQSVMLGACRGLSDTAFPASVSTVAYWAFGLPLGWLLATWGGWGPAGVWMGFLAALAASGAILTARFLARTGAGLRGLAPAV
jgi:MATE family multidrug resistance protein